MASDVKPVAQPTPTPSATPPTPAPQAPSDYLSKPRGDFVTRFIAWLIDVIIVAIIQSVIGAIVGLPLLFSRFDAVRPFDMASRYSAASGLSLLVGIAYYVYFWGATGATPGKMALGLKVIGTDGTMPIGYVRAFIRYIGYIISAIICLLGYLLIIVDDQKQGLHDKIASTYVVKSQT
jgi:uncharacterized RDD family membrane protein YckC